jgi:anti-sigma factor RsiW
MTDDLLNILSNSNKDIDNQQLMDYLSGKLSNKERHEVEQSMADSDFMNDAVEGLQHFPDKKNPMDYVNQLNESLKSSLRKKKQRREKRRIKENPWVFVAILLILTLCIAAYFLVRMYLRAPR